MSSEVNISDPAIRAELAKLDKLDGGVPFRASSQHAHHTWARTFHSSPDLYIQPESLEEVEKAITLARRCRKRITTVGCGHSPSDMTCTSSWMMNLDKFNNILSVNKEAGLVTMQAGMRLYQLGAELDKLGLAMPNLGSINEQSIAGAISTGTHGSTLRHSILSSSVTSLRITLANSRTLLCSPDENEELFRAALCSLGALGVVTEITFQAVPAFNLHWSQTLYPDSHILNTWKDGLWTQAEFVRVWWFPYGRRSTIWKASKTDESPDKLPYKPSFYDSKFGYTVYHNLLYLAHYVPRILPWVEWFVFGMQYGFSTGPKTTVEAIQPSREALLMDCLYSQYVNEWALPLHNGPTALRRLSSWLNKLKPADPDYVEHGIPFSAEGIWVHAPIEVRVSDTTVPLKNNDGTPRKSSRPYLDSTSNDGPTLYLNATLYRPYNMDPPCRERYYEGFEYLMMELGGKPHWAKNFQVTREQIEAMYGDDLTAFRRVRDEADPEGLFTGPWHRRYILAAQTPRLLLEEVESTRKPLPTGGVEVFGELSENSVATDDADYVSKPVFDEAKKIALQEKKEAEKLRLQKIVDAKAASDAAAEQARLQKIADDKAASDAALEKARLQKIADDKAASDAALEKARLQKIADDKAASDAALEKARLQKIADDKAASDAALEKARLQKIADDKAASDAALEKARLQKIADEKAASDAALEKARLQKIVDEKAASDAAIEQARLQKIVDEKAAFDAAIEQARLQKIEDEKAASDAALEKARLQKIVDEKAASDAAIEQARLQKIADDKAASDAAIEKARLQKIVDDKAASDRAAEQARLQQIEDDKAAAALAKEQEELRLQQQADQKAAAALAEQQRVHQEEQQRLKKLEQDRIASELEAKRVQQAQMERKSKEESDRIAAQKAEDARLAAVKKQEEDDRLTKEAETARIEQERVVNERRKKEQIRAAAEKAEKERQIAERKKKAEEERVAAIEKRKRDDEHNAMLAAAEAQRLREEASERHALRQQQLQEAAEARAREEHEKKMVAEHDRRMAAKAEAEMREKQDRERIARVAHDNEVRLERGRLAREAKEREERLERERLAEDARKIEQQKALDEKRRQIQEKKEAQRIAIRAKQAERKEIAAQKKALEDSAAQAAKEQQRLKDQEEAKAKAERAAAVRKAFQAQVAARAAKAAAAESASTEQNTPTKTRRSLSPKTNGRPATPVAKADENDAPRPKSKSGGHSEKSKLPTPSSPRSQRIFRPTVGTPTPSVLLAKREGLDETSDFAPAQKRIKLHDQLEEPLPVKKAEKAWMPQHRPNSLDELLAEQETEAQEGDNSR